MSALEELLSTDRVWDRLSSALLGRSKHSGGRFITICCPMCQTRGETADKRFRCGVIHDATGIGVNCFNCAFKARFKIGETLSLDMKGFMVNLGIPSEEVNRLSLWAWTINKMAETEPDFVIPPAICPTFEDAPLPHGCKTIHEWATLGCDDTNFLMAAEYLLARGDDIANACPYYWTPDRTLRQRLIMPCTINGHVVGWIGRAVRPNIVPKYLNETPPNILFNADALTRKKRKYVIIVEGVFDAIAVDGIALLGTHLNERQTAWINSSDMNKIVVPDRDIAGLELIRLAKQNNWMVSNPGYSTSGEYAWWDNDIKDVADAVKAYGRLWTLRSIIANATDSAFRIELWEKTLLLSVKTTSSVYH